MGQSVTEGMELDRDWHLIVAYRWVEHFPVPVGICHLGVFFLVGYICPFLVMLWVGVSLGGLCPA